MEQSNRLDPLDGVEVQTISTVQETEIPSSTQTSVDPISQIIIQDMLSTVKEYDPNDLKSMLKLSTYSNISVPSTFPSDVRLSFEKFKEIGKEIDSALANGVKNVRDILVSPARALLSSLLPKEILPDSPSSQEESAARQYELDEKFIDKAVDALNTLYQAEEDLDSLSKESNSSVSEKIADLVRNQNRPRLRSINDDPILSIQVFLEEIKEWAINIASSSRSLDVNFWKRLNFLQFDIVNLTNITELFGQTIKAIGSKTLGAVSKTIAVVDDVARFLNETKFRWSFSDKPSHKRYGIMDESGLILELRRPLFIPHVNLSYQGIPLSNDNFFNEIVEEKRGTVVQVYSEKPYVSKGVLISVPEDQDDWWDQRFEEASRQGNYSDADRIISFFTGLPLKRHFLGFNATDYTLLSSAGAFSVALSASVAAMTASGIFGRLFAAGAATVATITANSVEMANFYNNHLTLIEAKPYITKMRYSNSFLEENPPRAVIPFGLWALFPWSNYKLLMKAIKLTIGVTAGVAASAAIGVISGKSARAIRTKIRERATIKKNWKRAKEDIYNEKGELIQAKGDRPPAAYVQNPDGSFMLDSKGRKMPLDYKELKAKVGYSSFIGAGGKLAAAAAGGAGVIKGINSLQRKLESKKVRDDLDPLSQSLEIESIVDGQKKTREEIRRLRKILFR